MNLVEATLVDGEVAFAGLRIPVGGPRRAAGRVVLGIRPQAFEDAALADSSLPAIDVVPAVVEDLGSELHVVFEVDPPPVDAEAAGVAPGRALFTATVGAGSAIHPHRPARLAIDSRRFHYFDPQSGRRLPTEPPRAE